MRFLSLIFKNLTRRPFRTSLTLLAFATAIAAVVSLLGIAKGFTRSFADIYESHNIDIVVSRQGSADRLSSSVDESFAARIAQLPAVDKSAGVLLETMSLEEKEIYGIPSMGLADDSWLLADYKITSVPQVSILPSDQRRLMLGINLAQRAGVGVGDRVMIFEEPYIVTGIFTSQSTWENGSMIFPLQELQRLTDRTRQVTYINVVLNRPTTTAQATAAVNAIQELDAKLHPLTTKAFVETDTRMQIASAMAWMTSMIALVIGAIGTLNTMMTSVLERTREIGILRAMGWPRSRVVTMILLESCVLAVLACLLGSLLAILLTWGLSASSATRGILTPNIDAVVLVQGAAIAVIIGILGAMLPAWRAAQLLPTEAFREGV
ncbi:MAG: ABC transporter permease [Pirellulaceae bacterium]|nr:ABC transporter permease [Pirellulaceae bacterium]